MIKEVFLYNYGCGNFSSLRACFNTLGLNCWVISDTDDLQHLNPTSLLVLPGVGNFSTPSSLFQSQGLFDRFQSIYTSIPILGICLGFQFMFESSQEAPDHQGLGWFKGSVLHLPPSISQRIGWFHSTSCMASSVSLTHSYDLALSSSNPDYFYYNHSYYIPFDLLPSNSFYGSEDGILSSLYSPTGVVGFQFHPEKSQKAGLKALQSAIDYLSDL